MCEALADTPVVVIQGPRQCGKSTLAEQVRGERDYVTLDDPEALEAATRRPDAFLSGTKQGLVIDEIQRAPGLFLPLKKAVDQDRRPGRFLLTGSANVMLLPRLADSLAGRMEAFDLWPFASHEGEERISAAFAGELESTQDDMEIDATGFPEPQTREGRRRAAWFDAYLKALMERDIRDLSQIEGRAYLPSLLRLLADRAGETVNIAALGRDTGIPPTSLKRYLGLLEGVYLVRQIPAWLPPEGRAIKGERLAFVDAGLQSRLSQRPEALLYSRAALELVKQASWAEPEYAVRHFRSIRRFEVPLVVERGDGMILGLTLSADSQAQGLEGLRFLRELAGDRFAHGYALSRDAKARRIEDRIAAAPLAALL